MPGDRGVHLGFVLVISNVVAIRSAPSTEDAAVVTHLGHLQEFTVLGSVKHERWIVGDQT